MSEKAFRCFMRSAKNKTHVISINGESIEDVVHYVYHFRADLEGALDCKLKSKSPVLVEIIGGKLG